MATLVKVTLMMVTVVLLVAPISSSDVTTFETENSCANTTLPSSAPALTLIKFSMAPDGLKTAVDFQIHYIGEKPSAKENFFFSRNDSEKNIIAVLYQQANGDKHIGVLNILTKESKILYSSISHISVCTNQTVTWEVAHNNFAFLTKTAVSTTPANTTLPSTQSSPYLNPAFLALAVLCAILTIATLVLSVLQSHGCASSRSGLQGTASSTDDTTFKSTETTCKEIPYPLNDDVRGSLHVSENSLYGVL